MMIRIKNFRLKLALVPIVFLVSNTVTVLPSLSQATSLAFNLGVQEASRLEAAKAIDTPHPEIPPYLKEQCFKSCCLARLFINSNGKTSAKLISSSGCAEVDDITLETLQRWKFRPAMLNGKPVSSTRKVRVEFDVE
jgi:TonB family protein